MQELDDVRYGHSMVGYLIEFNICMPGVHQSHGPREVVSLRLGQPLSWDHRKFDGLSIDSLML